MTFECAYDVAVAFYIVKMIICSPTKLPGDSLVSVDDRQPLPNSDGHSGL